MAEPTTSSKVLKYETFLNETLRADLRRLLEQRDKVYSEQVNLTILAYHRVLVEYNKYLHFSRLNQARAVRGHLDKLRRYHTRPLPFNWGPENLHLGKTHFRDPNIDARVVSLFFEI